MAATPNGRGIGSNVLKGMVAGVAGTAAMTAAQSLEMRLSHRAPSLVPGEVASRLLRIKARGERKRRLSTAMHWGHGVFGGAVRGLLAATGAGGPTAGALHFALLWSTDVTLYRALGIAPAPWRWDPQDLVTDLFHKGVYAGVTNVVFEALRDGSER